MAINLLIPSGLGLDLGFNLNSSKVSMVIMIFLLVIVARRRMPVLIKFDKIVLYFLCYVIVSAFFATMSHGGGFVFSLKSVALAISWVLAYFTFYFAGRFIPKSQYDVYFILKGLLCILLVCAAIGILEHFLQINIFGKLGKILGLKDLGSGDDLWRGAFYRSRSSLDQPIPFGYSMVCGYLVADMLSKIKHVNNGVLLRLIFLVAVVFSGSRSAMLTLLSSMILLAYSSMGKYNRIVLFLLFLACMYWPVMHFKEIFFFNESFIAGDDALIGPSGNLIGRVRDIFFVLKVISTAPLTGIGAGLLHDMSSFARFYPALSSDYDGALDNMFLSVIVENGIIGVIFMVLIGIVYLKFIKMSSRPVARLYMVTIAFAFLCASFSYDILVFSGSARLMLFLIALSVTDEYFVTVQHSCNPVTITPLSPSCLKRGDVPPSESTQPSLPLG